ncbi:MAG: hypothetical protein Q4D05_01495 [Acinetobacter sp.]|nr:hypothetical protein [Acinetobacter sp.]
MAHHDDHHVHIELPPVKEPTWAKIAAPLVAFAVLAYLYCAYSHLMA